MEASVQLNVPTGLAHGKKFPLYPVDRNNNPRTTLDLAAKNEEGLGQRIDEVGSGWQHRVYPV
jgi:hypothetical protein